MRDDGSYSQDDFGQIIDNALVPSAMGTVDSGMDPYNNAVVYFFAFLGLFFVLFGVVAICIAIYRIGKHRSHAVRGLVVAIVASLVGTATLVAALATV